MRNAAPCNSPWACTRAGTPYLDNVLPDNVVQRLEWGVMIGAGGSKEAAEIGRRAAKGAISYRQVGDSLFGSVCAAESESYGDLGVETPTGFLTVRELGFAALDVDQIPMQLFPHARRLPFVTVNTCSGTNDLSSRIQARTNGAVESMEGAAIAHVAARERIPCGEIRGISNFTGDRDRSTWRVREAAEAAQQALLEWLTTH